MQPATVDQGTGLQIPTVYESSNQIQALDLAASPQKYPQTTAAVIGWRHDSIGHLERFGHHAQGKTSIRKLLKWPREAVY